jgi:hypothetical protein
MPTLYYSIDITQRSINGTIFRGYIVVNSTTNVITAFYKDFNFGVNILAYGTNIFNADNIFLNNNFSYNGTTIATFPILANTYQGTAWNLYYDAPTQRIAYRNSLGEWIDLPDDYNFTFISIPKLPVVVQPIPFCVQNNNKLTCMKTVFTQKGNKRFDSGSLVTQISKSMRYAQVQRMPKNSICVAQPAVKPPIVENTVSQFKSLILINTLITNFSFPGSGGSQIPGQYIACSYNGQYVTIVCKTDILSNNTYGIFVSSNYGVTFQPILTANVHYTPDNFYMHSVSVSYTGQYQFAVTNGTSSSSIGVYYSNTFGATWNQFLYTANNGINVSSLRWSQCTCISPSGQYMFAGGGGSGDGYGTGSGTGPGTGTGGWYDYYSNDYGATWQVAGGISDRISCTMNPNTFDVISVVNFNSAVTSFPGLFLKTNQTNLPINETTSLPPDSNSRPFKITSDDNSNVFMIAINNVNHQLNNGLLDPDQDFLNPTTPMYGYYSSDSGNTYGGAITLPGAFLHIAYTSSGNRLWACSHNVVYYSKNNGTSWYTLTTNIDDIYGMALSRDGQHLYLMEQARTNNIYRANISAF